MTRISQKTVAVIVAHPDDETLWAGGTILSHPTWQWFIVSLCRGSDPDRSAKFYRTLKRLKAEGIMSNFDDGPDQHPLDEKSVERAIIDLLPPKHFDLVITHNPTGEYTKHLRHEEVGKAVIRLWTTGKISSYELWTFAYEDGNKEYYPKAIQQAPFFRILPEKIWKSKYALITETYGFDKNSWEAQTTPKAEAFWQFTNPADARFWLKNGGVQSQELNIDIIT